MTRSPAAPALDPEKILATAEALQRRIAERFPDSGLGRLALELNETARRTAETARGLAAPVPWTRALVGVFCVLAAAAFFGSFSLLQGTKVFSSVAEFFQGLDAFINELVLFGVAFVFLFTAENRIKRARALKSLSALRALAHVVDMHQLTKDPERVAGGASCNTASSPVRSMTPFELTRYLDYCTEMLALLSKLAALHVQQFDDPVTLEAVNDLEHLAQGLARTIWQKIMILDRIISPR